MPSLKEEPGRSLSIIGPSSLLPSSSPLRCSAYGSHQLRSVFTRLCVPVSLSCQPAIGAYVLRPSGSAGCFSTA